MGIFAGGSAAGGATYYMNGNGAFVDANGALIGAFGGLIGANGAIIGYGGAGGAGALYSFLTAVGAGAAWSGAWGGAWNGAWNGWSGYGGWGYPGLIGHPNGALVPVEPEDVLAARKEHLALFA